jgi:hypothetical protein
MKDTVNQEHLPVRLDPKPHDKQVVIDDDNSVSLRVYNYRSLRILGTSWVAWQLR